MEKPRHNAATVTPLEVRTDTRYSIWSVLSPCLFYNLILEGAIVTDSLSHSEKSGCVGGKNTNLGGRTETDTQHLEEDQNCTFLSVRIKQTKYL